MLLRYETARGQAGVNDKVQAPSHINITDGTMSVNCEKILKSEQESGLQPSTYYVHTEVARHGEHWFVIVATPRRRLDHNICSRRFFFIVKLWILFAAQ